MKAFVLSAVAVAVAAAALVGSPARAAGSGALLAPIHTCPSPDETAAPVVQQRALACLVNWARSRAGVGAVRASRALGRSARARVERMIACGELSHAPCGEPLRAPASARRGYRTTGENLFYGAGGLGTPRQAVAGWLGSATHRAILLDARWQELGSAVRRVARFDGNAHVAVWVLHVGTLA